MFQAKSLLFAAPFLTFSAVSLAQEPQRVGRVIVTGAEREQIESTPIELRPNRPLHFYGNAVRRQYYRGSAFPAPRDFSEGASALRRR